MKYSISILAKTNKGKLDGVKEMDIFVLSACAKRREIKQNILMDIQRNLPAETKVKNAVLSNSLSNLDVLCHDMRRILEQFRINEQFYLFLELKGDSDRVIANIPNIYFNRAILYLPSLVPYAAAVGSPVEPDGKTISADGICGHNQEPMTLIAKIRQCLNEDSARKILDIIRYHLSFIKGNEAKVAAWKLCK